MRFLFVLIVVVGGCDCSDSGGGGSGGVGDPCSGTSDCNAGLTCRDGRCQRPSGTDAGGEDGGPVPMCEAPRVCGDLCCDVGQICGRSGGCCAPAALCGGACCSADQRCEADRCVLDCAEGETECAIGTATEACCAAGDLCYLGACTTPGVACTSTRECAEGEYCETTVMRCLPRAMGELCEYRPPVGMLEIEEEWHWARDAMVMPAHDQVMMAPMVANLTDDDADGVVGVRDVPEVIFATFTGSDYWGNGILRAVRGSDGSRVWPAADPGYRVTPGGEVAIAELDPASLGPEVLACSASNSSTTTPGHLIMLAGGDGHVLREWGTAPNDVPCGFDAPAVGDMDGDGTPEIVIRWVIAHPDGTVVRRLRGADAGTSGFYTSLADVDGDMDLEVVGSNGVYRLDGTAVWERVVDVAGRPAIPEGLTGVADLDLDGDAEIIALATVPHTIRAIDAATGDDVWGPTDINPIELAAEIAMDTRRGGRGGGPPTIANFDDDPEPEIAFAGGFAYVIFEPDGTRKWWYETQDRSSRVTGSSIFDFEGDGIAEVLYNDELRFRVFRGPDGMVLFDRCNTSGTLKEYPIVADVDNDDHAEIVLMQNNYAFATCADGSAASTGIYVFGHPRNEWVRTRRIWNQHTYHVTNIEEDGRVPLRERANWSVPTLNNFRQNVQPDGLFDAPDLVLADLYASPMMCPSAWVLSVRVVNRGSAGAPAGVPVTFYDVTGGTRMRVGRMLTTRPLLPGESELLILAPPYPIPAGMDTATFRFEAVINDAGEMPLDTLHECRTENNGAGPIEAACMAPD
jgi:hypothetical protein